MSRAEAAGLLGETSARPGNQALAQKPSVCAEGNDMGSYPSASSRSINQYGSSWNSTAMLPSTSHT